MCFSATASFVTAAATGTAGLMAISRATQLREIPLAAMGLFFATQQGVEGFLWLTLAHDPNSDPSRHLVHIFLFIALVFWPAFAPSAALLVEPDAGRARLIAPFVLTGSIVALYLFSLLFYGEQSARLAGGHIIYDMNPGPPAEAGLTYVVATACALGLSSHASIRLLAAVVFVGSLAAYWAYWDAFLSVWCFFAAAASGIILLHFERARKVRDAVVAPHGPA